jgi:hypothetical protein
MRKQTGRPIVLAHDEAVEHRVDVFSQPTPGGDKFNASIRAIELPTGNKLQLELTTSSGGSSVLPLVDRRELLGVLRAIELLADRCQSEEFFAEGR